MNRFLTSLLLLPALVSFAQDKPLATPPNRAPADGPFVPAPALPGGIVLPLYPPDSPFLKHERIHEAERYNTEGRSDGKLLNTLNIHNPTIEVHLAPADAPKTGTAIIVAPGGGHKILWVGPEGYDLVPLFAIYGITTIVLRNRLRIDGYEPTTDAVNDALQSIRLVRSHAAEWKLDPAKIGIIGFSAGAELSAPAALFFDQFAEKNSDAS
ncbi:MAG: alpha/beta hydrolase, partial [Chthoniobacteraceae bacterium]